jgi:hypothetical protein
MINPEALQLRNARERNCLTFERRVSSQKSRAGPTCNSPLDDYSPASRVLTNELSVTPSDLDAETARPHNRPTSSGLTYVQLVRTLKAQARRPHARSDSGFGMGAMGRLLVVAYTWRGQNIRIISARPAKAHEREQYEAER